MVAAMLEEGTKLGGSRERSRRTAVDYPAAYDPASSRAEAPTTADPVGHRAEFTESRPLLAR